MSTVFLAPTLQPVTQSPQLVQAGCSRPAALGPAVNVTLMRGRKNSAPSSSADARWAACLGSGGSVSGYGVEPSMWRARSKPARQLGIGIVPERLRPRAVLEHPGVGLQGDIGVDQRRPAEAAADEDADVVGETEVVQPGPGPDVVAIGVGLHLAQGAERGARVLPRVELPAPLEDGDRHPGPGQPAGEDTAAIARSDHDDVVPGAHP